MNTLKLESALAEPIRRLIELRQIGGSDYHAQAQLLAYFDRFLVEQELAEPRLTQPLVEAYEKTLSHLVPRGRANRMCVVRQLCEYLSRSNPLTYVPEPLRTSSSQVAFAPYIYSEDEVRALLAAAASLPPPGSLRGPTYQTLLGLLYSTGLRIGEAMALDLVDFHRNDARLYIAQGKFHKARWVPLSTSTAGALSRYVDRRRQTRPCSPDSPLFLNQRGHRLHHSTVDQCFHDLLEQCGITLCLTHMISDATGACRNAFMQAFGALSQKCGSDKTLNEASIHSVNEYMSACDCSSECRRRNLLVDGTFTR